MKKCDLGILLGGPILEKEFNELISIINSHVKVNESHSTKRIRLDESNFNWMPIPILDPTRAIERIHCPSMEEFLRDYMKEKKPVILTGCIDHWPAMQKWRYEELFFAYPDFFCVYVRSFDYLIKLAGDRTVPIELGSRYSDDDWTQKLMTIADFVNQHCLQRSARCGYLAQHPLLDQVIKRYLNLLS